MKVIEFRGFWKIYAGLLGRFTVRILSDILFIVILIINGTGKLESESSALPSGIKALLFIESSLLFLFFIVVLNGLIEAEGKNMYMQRCSRWLTVYLIETAVALCILGMVSITKADEQSELYRASVMIDGILLITVVIISFLLNRDLLLGYHTIWSSFGIEKTAKKIKIARITLYSSAAVVAASFVSLIVMIIIKLVDPTSELGLAGTAVGLIICLAVAALFVVDLLVIRYSRLTAKMINDISN